MTKPSLQFCDWAIFCNKISVAQMPQVLYNMFID
uniref:Uncharacterized protein n=1 Tax=Salmonella phage PMBT27 TaxID=3137285 RepID=A0AAU8BUL9_9VIRU